ncbi:uncharacterized protein JCM15063_005129 [Sporobolomyces koalae]|uniref:uncharacterized protein n=1 Tax=Sporobolomyces koalae TaxID=500713 RepID=UPI00317DCDCE
MSLSASGDLESKARLRSRASAWEFISSTEFEFLAAHDDEDLESYSSPWNALEEMGGKAATEEEMEEAETLERIEMFSWPGARSGETWSYTWKSHQGATSVTSKFFHTWQLLRRDCGGGPIITLDLKGGKAVISDDMRGCVDCVSVDANVFMSRTIQHQLTVTFGLNGSISYRAYDVTPSPIANEDANALGLNLGTTLPVIKYEAYGDMGDQASIKFGQYRAVTEGLLDVTTFVGDYSATRDI